MSEWLEIQPKVDDIREFHEIASDFADPLEAIREAISNAYDWNATKILIRFEVKKIEGEDTLILSFWDNGEGLSKKAITSTFWGLGLSESRGCGKIGEKGHGTKIFLRSKRIKVKTRGPDGYFEAVCERPFGNLTSNRLHLPQYCEDVEQNEGNPFTEIIIEGYNFNERTMFKQAIVKDYILWFTKAGSIEKEFPGTKPREIKVFLKCLDWDSEPEDIPFGHAFPVENKNTHELFEKYGADAPDHFVKKYVEEDRLKRLPEVSYQAVIYVEGDLVKRQYNHMIRQKLKTGSEGYRVSDRYGIWLCKDYIPIQRKNEWVKGFGTGSNAYVWLHGFINCQNLSLTANRGDISNSDPFIIEELKEKIENFVSIIDEDMKKK